MWSYSRRSFILSLSALSGCGFRPVYGPSAAATALRGRIRVREPKDADEFFLLHRLEERFGRPEGARYRLDYKLETRERGLAITPAQETTRFHVLGRADFTLVDTASGKAVTSGSVDGFTGYSAIGTTISTKAAREDAYRRLMVILADKITSRLLATPPGEPG